MHHFEDAFAADFAIPFQAAADFFIGIRAPLSGLAKTASLEDEPDTSGVLEGQFEVPVENVAELMKQAVTIALVLSMAGTVYGSSVQGPTAEPLCRLIRGDYELSSMAGFLTRRLVALTGESFSPEIPPIPPTTDPKEVARLMLRGHQEFIHALQELCLAVGHHPMTIRLKQCQLTSDEVATDLRNYLAPEDALQPIPQAPSKLERHEEDETPEQEAAESPAFEAAEEAAGVEPEEHEKAAGLGAVLGNRGARAAIAATVAGGLLLANQLRKQKKTAADSSPSQATRVAMAEAQQKGLLAGYTQANKDYVTDLSHKRERAGKAVGGTLGAVGGALAGKKLIGGKAGAIAGLAGGYLAGGGLGKELGRSGDIHNAFGKTSSERLREAYLKLAEGEASNPAGTDVAKADPSLELQPTNYMQSEMMGQQVQEQMASTYYKMQAEQAQQAVEAAQQQAMSAQQQLQQMQMQQDMAGQQVAQATQQAMTAQEEALRQSQLAANMRIGMQNLRAQIMQIASQDPNEGDAQALIQDGAPLGQAPESDPAMTGAEVPPEASPQGAPPAEAAPKAPQGAPKESANASPDAGMGDTPLEGPAGLAPKPLGAPQSPVPFGATQPTDVQPNRILKVGAAASMLQSRLPWMAAGAGLGVLDSVRDASRVPELQQNVQELESQDKSFGQAFRLALARTALGKAELAQQYPIPSAAVSAAGGALMGSSMGPVIGKNIRTIMRNS